MEASVNRIRALLFVLLAATLSSCSSNSDNPLTPPPPDDGAPSLMVTIIGAPRVKVLFKGNLIEPGNQAEVTGAFSVAITDSVGRRAFLGDVRLQGVPMHEEFDGLGQPSRYTLDVSELPGVGIGDTLRFDVLGGGGLTPPFSYRILPSYVILPPDSTVIHQSQDLVLPWTGAIERVLVTVTDITTKRLTFNYQVENYTGGSKFTIPARDFAGLYVGPLFVGTNVRDSEDILSDGQALQSFELITHQDRTWILKP